MTALDPGRSRGSPPGRAGSLNGAPVTRVPPMKRHLAVGDRGLIVGGLHRQETIMRIAGSLTALLLFGAFPAFQGSDRPQADPPSRVGRLSYLAGSVSFRPGDVDDWAAATVNYPLHSGDHLWTDADGRAEITVGSTAFRLAPQSAFGFLALDDGTVQVRLSPGSLNVRVRDLGESESLEIDTPSGAVTLLRSGVYRVDVDSTGDTTSVTVRRGEAEVTASGSAFPVHPEQTAMEIGRAHV